MQIPPTASHEHARLALLNRSALLDTPAEIEFDRIVQLAAGLFRVPIALVSLIDAQRQWFKAKVGVDVCETGREVSFCGHVVASGRMLVVDNALQDDRFADNPLVLGDPSIRFYAGAPLLISDQLAIGTLCLIDRQPRQFNLQDQTLLQQLADTLSDLIRKRMAVQLGQRQLRLLLTINQAQSSFLLDRDLGAACSTITQSLLDMSHCTLGFIASCQVNDSDTPYLAIPSIAHQQQDALQWLMRQLVPDMQRVLLLFDNDLTSEVIQEELFGRASSLQDGKIQIDLVRAIDYADWQRQVHEAPGRYQAIWTGLYQTLRDANGKVVPDSDVIAWTAANSKLPLFAFWDFAVGADKAVGGLVLSGRDQGRLAAGLVQQILFQHRQPGSLFPLNGGGGQLLFSRGALQRFGLQLPPAWAGQVRLIE